MNFIPYLLCLVSFCGASTIAWWKKLLGIGAARIVPVSFPVALEPELELTACEVKHSYATRLAKAVTDSDNKPFFSPWMDANRVVRTSIGSFTVGSRLAAGSASLVFDLHVQRWNQELVLKYFSDCGDHTKFLPGIPNGNIREYAMGVVLSREGIAPRVRFLSGADLWNRKFSAEFPNARRMEAFRCENVAAEVRFMMMDKTGPTMNQYFKAFEKRLDITPLMYVARVIEVARLGLKQIRKMHDLGIVHGDIHGGNIACKNEACDQLVLLDFGLSGFVCGPLNEEIRRTCSYINPELASGWQLEADNVNGFRDDVFRFFELLSKQLGKRHLSHEMDRLAESMSDWDDYFMWGVIREMKVTMKYFAENNMDFANAFFPYDALVALPEGQMKTRVATLLEEAMDYIKAIGSPTEPVNFDYIENKLEQVMEILTNTSI